MIRIGIFYLLLRIFKLKTLLAVARIFQTKRCQQKCRLLLNKSRCSAFFSKVLRNTALHAIGLFVNTQFKNEIDFSDTADFAICHTDFLFIGVHHYQWIWLFPCPRQFGASYTINLAIKSNGSENRMRKKQKFTCSFIFNLIEIFLQ